MGNDPKFFRIPKEFTLFGHKYTIVIDEELFEKEKCYGIADEDKREIRIQPTGPVVRKGIDGEADATIIITDASNIETFYHELIHIVLDALGEETLSENERFVNMLAKAFLEVYLSARYEEKIPKEKREG